MADEKQEQQEQQDDQQAQGGSESSGGTGTAVKAVAAAAATGAAALAARKVMSGRGGSNGHSGNGSSPRRSEDGSVLSSVLSGGWDAARDALLPAAEDAAGAAGEYVAQHGPEVLRDRIVPRFVDAFNEARGGS
jgi:hypothetical protein